MWGRGARERASNERCTGSIDSLEFPNNSLVWTRRLGRRGGVGEGNLTTGLIWPGDEGNAGGEAWGV